VVRARAATSGLLLRFAAHLWSVLLDLPADLAASSERAAEVFGLVAQFADDVLDWTQDDGVAQNLLGAALVSWPRELAALRVVAHGMPGRSIPYAVLKRLAPRSLADLDRTRRYVSCYPDDPRYAGLRRFGDDVYETLLPALPAVDFRDLDPIRQAVQSALA
jgi:geranylgeranyl pyrophosphate synthase